ncbi:MAG: glutamine--fructose-6-phosphate transaminase (isomerizing) [Synergistaceae bacterium]|nr:glutamine--fructose-6-phosphate transaminase (isomerizing) [Synergistaceae bacterium]MBQ6737555.1 glutamine--fructose-6-phosphate transaminase (isomerizing) [Synergistaceae bacterium]MBR0316195.1 glutamine--fructose-6-phosphate transaminase (isomerizing) [Synergistaceae bacterium]
MCGILGYTGNRQASDILLNGLAKLEYRGYDSAGLAVLDKGEIKIAKNKGRLKVLEEKIKSGHEISGTCGIGHTRWATHGEPSDVNAHPLWSDDKDVVIVHNGIVENYREIKNKLSEHGYKFYSQTDTEAAVKLIDFYYKQEKNPLKAILKAIKEIEGSYCFVMLFKDFPDEVWGARKDLPLIAGQGKDESFLASDVSAILQDTRQVYYLDNMEIVQLKKGVVRFFDTEGYAKPKELSEVTWDMNAAEKGGFEHFMMKEIHEQARAVKDTFGSVYHSGKINLNEIGLNDENIKSISQIYIIACGSAYHAGAVAQYVIEDLAKIPVRIELASEFRYRNMPMNKNSLAIIISQSGETADTLAAMRRAKENGIKTLAIVNVVGSTIAREADSVFYTMAGPEIAVATTKAYSAQLIACYVLAMQFAKVRNEIEDSYYEKLMSEIQKLPEKIDEILDAKETLEEIAYKFVNSRNAFYLGRNIDYAVAMEGSLKMKEISYLHSEAIAAGEMKHGPISLIEKGMLVAGVMTQKNLYQKIASNMLEAKSRGGFLLIVATRGCENLKEEADLIFYVPETDEHFAASLAVIPLQLLGYYVAVARKLDVDKPRNLAKSVTVE